MKSRRVRGLVGGLILTLAMTGVALADAGNPETVNADVDGMTVTLDGTWSWDRDNCDRFIGWAVDWNDPDAVGNLVADDVYVGTPTDNAVHTNNDCGTTPGEAGNWGPIEHTYTTPGEYEVCVVIYDLHLDKDKVDKLDGAIDDSQTTITLDDTTGISVGDILSIKDSDEYLTVVSVDNGTDLTVQRGTNGSTAESAADNKDVYIVTVKADDLIAGGDDRNKDNSVEDNYTEGSCASVDIEVSTPTPTPEGSVADETDPPTDLAGANSGSADSLGLVLMALAGILATIMVVTPARARRR